MNGVALLALVIILIAVVMAVVIVWDRLVGTALVGVVAGATWVVAQSHGRWWFWPVMLVAALTVIAAFVTAVLIS
jgi:uncharacterized membrane protein